MTKTRVRYLDLDVAPLLSYSSSMGSLAERVGVTRRTLHRLALSGLTIVQADEFAFVVGAHPCDLWPCWPDPVMPVRCAWCRYCSRQIVQPIRRGARIRRVCSQRCADRHRRRGKYLANAEHERALRRARYWAKKVAV